MGVISTASESKTGLGKATQYLTSLDTPGIGTDSAGFIKNAVQNQGGMTNFVNTIGSMKDDNSSSEAITGSISNLSDSTEGMGQFNSILSNIGAGNKSSSDFLDTLANSSTSKNGAANVKNILGNVSGDKDASNNLDTILSRGTGGVNGNSSADKILSLNRNNSNVQPRSFREQQGQPVKKSDGDNTGGGNKSVNTGNSSQTPGNAKRKIPGISGNHRGKGQSGRRKQRKRGKEG